VTEVTDTAADTDGNGTADAPITLEDAVLDPERATLIAASVNGTWES